MTGKDALYGVGAVIAGLVAYKVFKTASAVSSAGGKAVDGALAAAKEIVTKDLNPASPENVVYRAANVLTGGSDDRPIGSRLYDFFNPAYNPNAPVQTTVAPNAKESFRRLELIAGNEQSAALAAADVQMSDRKNTFRLSEINQDPVRQYSTDPEIWAAPALAQSTGA